MIKLISDSTSYMPKEIIKKYDIDIIPLSVILGAEIITETEISNEKFFKKLDNSNHHPTSSQPTIDQIYSTFEKYAGQGDSIIFICISSQMSGTYSTALTVKNMIIDKYPDAQIEVIDSKSNCMQLGYAVLAGAKEIAQDKSFKQVIDSIKDNITKSRMLFIPETLKYLQKSGRLSKAKALAASILQIVPILTVIDGKADVFAKIRTRKKAKNTMLAELQKDIDANKVTDISVVHINNDIEANKFILSIKELINIDINLSSIGPVIGAHVGPGSLGVVWCKA